MLRKLAIVIACVFPVMTTTWFATAIQGKPSFSEDQYYTVLLDNAQVYFGKIQDGVSLGEGRFTVLSDVYYIRTNPKENDPTKSILLRRGQEWHKPDRMFLNMDHVVLIEPVSPDSRVSKLISELRQKESK